MGWLWKKRERDDSRLLRTFLSTDQKRIEASAALDAKKVELEMRRLELEMEHIEALGEERRKDRADAEKARQARRDAAARAREAQALKRSGARTGAGPVACPVCADPMSVHLTAEEIWWHGQGHPAGGPQAVQWPS